MKYSQSIFNVSEFMLVYVQLINRCHLSQDSTFDLFDFVPKLFSFQTEVTWTAAYLRVLLVQWRLLYTVMYKCISLFYYIMFVFTVYRALKCL